MSLFAGRAYGLSQKSRFWAVYYNVETFGTPLFPWRDLYTETPRTSCVTVEVATFFFVTGDIDVLT